MSYVLGVILGLSLINTIFLVNNLKTNTENKKQLDNLYNFTIHNIEITNNNIDKKNKSIEINDNQDKTDDNQDKNDDNQDKTDDNQDKNDDNQNKNDDNQDKKDDNQDKIIVNHNELTNSVSQGFPQWSFLNLGRTLKQKSISSSLSLSKIE